MADTRGCEACHQSHYTGRVAAYELLRMTDPLQQMVVRKEQAGRMRQLAIREGMRTLREDGRQKVRAGVTTMAEVVRVAPEE